MPKYKQYYTKTPADECYFDIRCKNIKHNEILKKDICQSCFDPTYWWTTANGCPMKIRLKTGELKEEYATDESSESVQTN